MKTLKLVCLSKEDKAFYENIRSKRILIFKFDGDKNYFKNKNKRWERFKISLLKLNLNTRTIKELIEIVFHIIIKSHLQVAEFGKTKRPDEDFDYFPEYYNFGKLDPNSKLYSQVELWVDYLDRNGKLDVTNLCCWIPFKLLTSHHIWNNGNKRTALATCINMLRFFHLYLSYSKRLGFTDDGEDRWYNLFKNYVRDDKNPEKCVELNPKQYYKIYEKFYNDIIIAIYFDAYGIKEDK